MKTTQHILKVFIFLFCVLSVKTGWAQNVGISPTNGFTPDASAALDVSFSNKGLLIPRVALTATNAAGPVTSPAVSLLVYNTATAGTAPNNVAPGYYYWNGVAWIGLTTAAQTTSSWATIGNSGTSYPTNFLGTTDNFGLHVKTNNTHRFWVDSLGSVAVGTSPVFSANREKLLVDASTTTSYNVISGKGNINNYLQLNIQNNNAGTAASSDVVATADNGNEAANYVDMGINSSANTAAFFGAANDAYLYNAGGTASGGNFYIGTSTAGKNLGFLTGGGTTGAVSGTNERMHIDGTTGNVGIANFAPSEKMDITGNLKFSGALMPNNNAGTSGYFLVSQGAGVAPIWYNANAYINTAAWVLAGNPGTNPATNFIGTTDAVDFVTRTSNTERFRVTSSGNVGIGTTTPTQKLDVNGSINAAANIISQGSVFVDAAISNTGTASPGLILGGVGSGESISSKRTTGTGQYGIDFYTAGTSRMSVANNGNLGIGNNTPTEKLDVTGNLKFSGALMPNNNPGTAGYILQSAGAGVPPVWVSFNSGWGLTGNAGTAAGTNFIGTTDVVDFVTRTNNIERFRVTSGGNVGIGTTTPAQKLDVNGSINAATSLISQGSVFVDAAAVNTGSVLPGIAFGGLNSGEGLSSKRTTGGNAFGLDFYTNTTNQMSITQAGKIGIGTSAPTEKLDITGNLKFSGALMPNNNPGTAGYILQSAGAGVPPVWVSSGASQAWGLTGNTGTTAGTNFLGTTDAQDMVFKANNVERMRIVNGTSSTTGTTGDITIGDATSGTLRSTKELVMRQDGDAFGPSTLRLRNRAGQNGAVFETTGGSANLVDFIFNTGAVASPISSNIRFETRSGNMKVSGNTTEWQFGQPDMVNGGPTLVVGAAGTGSNSSFLTGKVGIGTSNPATKLHVFGANPLTLSGVVTGTSTTADSLLTITSGLVRKLPMSTFTAGGADWLTTGNVGTTAGTNFIGTTDAVDFVVKTNNTEKARFTSTGNVGIGSTAFNSSNPEKLLVDAGTTSSTNVISGKGSINSYLQLNIQNLSSGNSASSDVVATADNGTDAANYVDMGINGSGNNGTFYFGAANDAYLYNAGGSVGGNFYIGNSTSAKILGFLTGGSAASNERMRIDGTGNVGIGTTTPSQLLDVNGSISATNSVYIDANNTNTGAKSPGFIFGGPTSGESISSKRTGGTNQYGIDFYTSSNDRMTIASGGNVGIGTTTPTYKLTVAGIVAPSIDNTYSLGGSTTNRWTVVYATSGTINTSDRRLKTNIKNLNYGLKEVLALQPVSYNWKKTPDTNKQLGLIAQDVRRVVPEVVVGDEAKENLGMNYAELIPVLINAIKEQQKEIDDLKKAVQKLQK